MRPLPDAFPCHDPRLPVRRRLLGGTLLAALAAAAEPAPALAAMPGGIRAGAPPPPGLPQAWGRFRQAYLRPEGRVVDTGNGGISHSEGQAWAMFCAERCAERADFERIWGWTRQNLRRPRDALLAWRFTPLGEAGSVDANNATDGDLFAATALLLAGRRWGDAALTEAGQAMARDILRLLLRRAAGMTLLLPGLQGFEEPERLVLNPSYYAFPLLGVLGRAVPDPAWLRLAADGLRLLRLGRFGRWGLPPDWLALRRTDGALALAEGRPRRFSYDAVRVPFYLCWAGLRDEPAVAAARAFWGESAQPPAWVDLVSGQLAPYAASEGQLALMGYVLRGPGGAIGGGEGGDYYSSVLKTLAIAAV